MKEICVGVVGLGGRGQDLLKNVILNCNDVTVTAVCDVYPDRAEEGAKIVADKTGKQPCIETDYKKVADNPNVDAVVIVSGWEAHVEIAIYSMLAGKAVAMEVGGAYSVRDCWKLVETYEQTKTPFMFMENCCYGRREMMALNMVQKGVLGEIVHCSGMYAHDLRCEVALGVENRHYRLNNYIHRNSENYPTHDLGPIAKILNINHGNRMLSLTSTASKAAGLKAYIKENKPEDVKLRNTEFRQGDIVTTVIKCAHGETITLTLDTTLPRYYSRGFTVRGTKGLYEEVTDSVFLDTEEDRKLEGCWRENSVGNAVKYEEEYDHPIWKRYLMEGAYGSHGGMDGLEFQVFFDCLRSGEQMPIDVYDAAAWMAITPLSEQSIANGSMPVEIPDFTNGKWILR